jgi:hypothetical protein
MGRFSTALHASFETLFFVQQHTFFNRFYFLQTFLQYASFLELPINSDLSTVGFSWNEGILTPYVRNNSMWRHESMRISAEPARLACRLHLICYYLSIPLWGVRTMMTSMAIFAIYVFIVVLAVVVFSYVSHAILNSTLERDWIATIARVLVGLVMTLYLPFLRIFLNGIDCQYFGTEPWRLPAGTEASSTIDIVSKSNIWQDATCFNDAIYILVWIISLIVSAVFIVLVLFLSLGASHTVSTRPKVCAPHHTSALVSHTGSFGEAHRAASRRW